MLEKMTDKSAHRVPSFMASLRQPQDSIQPVAAAPQVQGFFHEPSCTITYVVHDPESGCAAVIDPVLDYDPCACRSSTDFIDNIVAHIETAGLQVDWVLETHAHADHLSAAQHLKLLLGVPVAIGEHIRDVQRICSKLFNLGDEFAINGTQFDKLWQDGEQFPLGNLTVRVMHTPGHTPACVTYLIGDCAFIGDTLFMPDCGTARADFPGGDARRLYYSIQRILELPNETRLHLCHDYTPDGRKPAWLSTVGEQRKDNLHLHHGIDEEQFVRMREARDQTLDMPHLILPALQVNIRAGAFPQPESNGVSYLKVPVNVLN